MLFKYKIWVYSWPQSRLLSHREVDDGSGLPRKFIYATLEDVGVIRIRKCRDVATMSSPIPISVAKQ